MFMVRVVVLVYFRHISNWKSERDIDTIANFDTEVEPTFTHHINGLAFISCLIIIMIVFSDHYTKSASVFDSMEGGVFYLNSSSLKVERKCFKIKSFICFGTPFTKYSHARCWYWFIVSHLFIVPEGDEILHFKTISRFVDLLFLYQPFNLFNQFGDNRSNSESKIEAKISLFITIANMLWV